MIERHWREDVRHQSSNGARIRGAISQRLTSGGARLRQFAAIGCIAIAGLGLGGCLSGETYQRGFIADGRALDKVRPGVGANVVLQELGTPSTVSTVGNRTWYYVSQTTQRRLAFMKDTVVDQRVFTVYFDKNLKVERVANYGIEDGKVFDFISRSTPTGGAEQSFLRNLIRGVGSLNPITN